MSGQKVIYEGNLGTIPTDRYGHIVERKDRLVPSVTIFYETGLKEVVPVSKLKFIWRFDS